MRKRRLLPEHIKTKFPKGDRNLFYGSHKAHCIFYLPTRL
jgi:hypothetical protein